MKSLIAIFSLLVCTIALPAQTFQLNDLLTLADASPMNLTNFFATEGWKLMADDTLLGIDEKTMFEHNMKWVYKDYGDTTTKLKFFYKKKQNKTTYEHGYYENIQYTLACKDCFREVRDSVLATGWAKVQDERSDEQVMQTYDAGKFSVMLFTHFKKEGEYYDIIVFRKKPVQ